MERQSQVIRKKNIGLRLENPQRCIENMITSKEDLRLYLAKDKQALGKTGSRPKLIGDDIWKFQIALRRHEYYTNVKRGGGKTPFS